MSVLERNAASCQTTTTRPSAATSAEGTGGARSLPTSASCSSAIRAAGPKEAPPSRETAATSVAVSPPPRKTSTSVPSGCTAGIANTPSPAVTAGSHVSPPSGLVCTASTSRRTSVYPR